MTSPSILVFSDYYLPGHKSGGAMRTLENMVQHLGERFTFRFITRDRDLNSDSAYDSVKIGEWNTLSRELVYYVGPGELGFRGIGRLMRTTPHRIIYLNSFFSFYFTLVPVLWRRLGLCRDKSVLLAPRGELSEGALANKYRVKTAYLKLVKWFSLFDGIHWQASTELERQEIQKWFGARARISVACDFPSKTGSLNLTRMEKKPGELRLIFLSRIDFKKNLSGALEMVSRLSGKVTFDIYGPVADAPYWKSCQALMQMPANVSVQYKGPVGTQETVERFSNYDLFLFPTLGENFGHVILESLSAGTPVLISDRTPWNDLKQAGVGWSVPLEDTGCFVDVLEQVLRMGPGEFSAMSKNAASYAVRVKENPDIYHKNLEMFSSVLQPA